MQYLWIQGLFKRIRGWGPLNLAPILSFQNQVNVKALKSTLSSSFIYLIRTKYWLFCRNEESPSFSFHNVNWKYWSGFITFILEYSLKNIPIRFSYGLLTISIDIFVRRYKNRVRLRINIFNNYIYNTISTQCTIQVPTFI